MLEFGHFSPRSFERLIQALCIHVFGAGTTVFGSGPDGAREATFTGEIPFPSTSQRWAGYIVVQAKCREQLRNNIEDTNWLATQLRSEFDKYRDTKRRLKRPEYYLAATNVRLSAAAGIGGRDKIDELLRSECEELGIKGHHVWAADELEAILDGARDIRRTYTAWLTPSDVLSDLVQSLRRPNLSRLLPLALARDLRHERDIRLRDAGQETEKPIFIESVYVDLPFRDADEITDISSGELQQTTEGESNADDSVENDNGTDNIEEREKVTTIGRLLQIRSEDKLDPDSCLAQRPHGPRSNRIVLLGGPGQGKSTVGQFLCQLSRARMLTAASRNLVTPQTQEMLQPTLDRASVEGIPIGGPCRFPVRIDLPTFADALDRAKKTDQSLTFLAHIAARLSRELDCSVNVEDLRAWLTACPWFLVLDGLDEVPASGNRDEVIKSVEGFWDEVHLANADAMMVVTSRPQGYQQALSRRHWEHWELAPLNSLQAKRVASQLAEIRLSDVERREIVLTELQRSFSDPSTRLLSSTPLQVTILFGIALLKGAIPHAKWDLFERYYTLLRDRESQKLGQDAALFRDFKRQIDAIHYEAGFILQITAESAGSATSFLTSSQLTELITKILRADEFDDNRISHVVTELSRIATERLVLLAQRIEGRIAFEVRSLQEFMAAGQLTSASSVPITERLRAIALSAHWRHVYRIAASKIFSVTDLTFLRPDVVAICHALDNGDLGEEPRIVRAGARLAIDLLADGVAASAPRFKRALLRRAISNLDDGSDKIDQRLHTLLDEDTYEIFNEEINLRLLQENSPAANAAYTVLGRLLQTHPQWSEAKFFEYWPTGPDQVLNVFGGTNPIFWSPALADRITTAQCQVSPRRVSTFQRRIFLRTRRSALENEEIRKKNFDAIVLPTAYFQFWPNPGVVVGVMGKDPDKCCSMDIVPIESDTERFRFYWNAEEHGWGVIEAVEKFVKGPARESLCSVVEAIARTRLEDIGGLQFPWPIHSVIREHQGGCPIDNLINEIREGRFGDHSDWVRAEKRWVESGFVPEDFLKWNEGRYLNPQIGNVGAPAPAAIGWRFRSNQEKLALGYDVIIKTTEKIASDKKREDLVGALMDGLPRVTDLSLRKIAVNYLIDAIQVYSPKNWYFNALMAAPESWESDSFLALLERHVNTMRVFWSTKDMDMSKLDLTNRWRKLLPIFADGQLTLRAESGSEPIERLRLTLNDGDSRDIRFAFRLMNLATDGARIADVIQIGDAVEYRQINTRTLSLVLKKTSTSIERLALLLEMAKRELRHEQKDRRGFIEALRNELEAQLSPLTRGSELARLNLPQFQ
jgi:hypothetical protein